MTDPDDRETRVRPPEIPELLREPVGQPSGASKNPEESDIANVSTAWGVAMDFVGCVIGALLLGYFADKWQNTNPRYTLIGMVVGFTFALYRIIRRTLADEKKEQARRKAGKK